MNKRIVSLILMSLLLVQLFSGCCAKDDPAVGTTYTGPATAPSINSSAQTDNASAAGTAQETGETADDDLNSRVAALPVEPTNDVVQVDLLVLLASTGAEGLYKVQDASTGKHGIYEYASRSFVVEPSYDYMGYFNCGLAAVCKDGFWGYINPYGEKVIGLYYEEAGDFVNFAAAVRTNGRYGAIDMAGNTLVPTEYDEVTVDAANGFICALNRAETGFYAGPSIYYCDIYDAGGALLVADCFGYEVVGNRIFALTQEETGASPLKDLDWYKVYDASGNPLLNEGEYATLPINGISVIHGKVKRTNGSGYSSNSWYAYMDESGQLLTGDIYSGATPFSGVGYAVVEYTPSIQGSDYYLMDKSGNFLSQLPYCGGDYMFANEYMIYAYNYWGKPAHTLYCISTGETIGLNDVAQMVDGTNCIIVHDANTGLFGLYDGENLVLDYVYNTLTYDGAVITGTRGAETMTYTPVS